MGKEISLARKEKVGQPVLLAGSGIGSFGQQTIRGEQRAKATGHAKRHAGGPPISAFEAGKSDAETSGGNGHRKSKHGGSYKPGQSARRTKNRNSAIGRSAKELGIEWLDSRCELSPSKAHHLVARTKVNEGNIFECKYCHKVKWLPISLDNAIVLDRLLKVYGYDLGYQKFLDGYPTHVNGFPAAKRLLVQIQDIYYLRKAFPDGQLFSIALAGIVMDRDYPYDIEETEEEMP